MKTINATNYAIKQDGELARYTETQWQKFVETATKEGKPAPVPDKVQTFLCYEAETPEDFSLLVPNADVQVSLFNRGASLKQNQEIRELMEDPTFEPVDGGYDLSEALNRVAERRKASPEDRVKKLLAELDPAALERVMAALQAQSVTAVSA